MTNSDLNHQLKKDEDYIYIDKNIDYIELIKNIIDENNTEYYDKIRASGYNKALEHYTWDNWATIINDKLK